MHAMKKYLGILVLGLAIFLAAPATTLAQCPMCKAAVESGHGDEPNALAEGLNTGILYLFALPYLSFMVIGFFFYLGYKRKKQNELGEQLAADQAAEIPDGLNPNSPNNDGN